MPNTLAHLGIHTLITRAVLREADVKWIWAGAILPDLPWIAQRLARMAFPDAWAIDIRLYAIVQSSLFVTLFLAAALACLSRWPGRSFAILALGAVLHLGLDATQTKWANGVGLLAPFDWRLVNLGLYWPEDTPSHLLSALGAGSVIWAFARMPVNAARQRPGPWQGALFAALIAPYLLLPWAFSPMAEGANLHSTATLRTLSIRAGQPIAFDRAQLVAPEQLRIWTGEVLNLRGTLPPAPTTLSIRGRFVDATTVVVAQSHMHQTQWRDGLSYLGLMLAAFWWARAFWQRR